ncbi:MAG: hypothetical protein K5869_06430 [Saccharofermentans sp.]|nr:hypothetical protein [Saccharofermentans sp.]
MKASILYLYYDFMNLYGDNGNVRIMEKRLRDQGFDVEVIRKTITDDDISFEGFDLIYCGSGTESRLFAAAEHLKAFEDGFKSAVAAGTPVLFTGNAWGMLGRSITSHDGKKTGGLGLFGFDVREEIKQRFTGDAVESAKGFDKQFIGFINKCDVIDGFDGYMFKVEKTIGQIPYAQDGVRKDNLFGISLIGPVLVKNPFFAEYLVRLIDERHGVTYREERYEHEEKGYRMTLKALTE